MDERNRLVVVVQGGKVQHLFATQAIEALIIDRDVEGAGDAEIISIRGTEALVESTTAGEFPEVVAEYFRDAEEADLI